MKTLNSFVKQLLTNLLVVGFIGTSFGEEASREDKSRKDPTSRPKTENHTVFSADGTRIGFTKVGSGPIPVVVVHGALNSGAQWIPVARSMAKHCTCYVMDRWGRGGSESRTDYSLQREADDIGAVLTVAGPDSYLLGHSSGAIYALETALRFPTEGLILYEPPLHAGPEFERILDRIRAVAREERFSDVVSIFLRDEARIPEDELSGLRKTPSWEQMVALAPQSVREWEELVEVKPTVSRYRDVSVPTLLLAGTETKDHPSFATETLEGALPNARTVMLEGHGHGAHLAAPELLAREATHFLLETSDK